MDTEYNKKGYTLWGRLKKIVGPMREVTPNRVIPYSEYRANIDTGDIAFFEKMRGTTVVDKVWGFIVRRATSHVISHSGVLANVGKRILLVEAVPMKVRIRTASSRVPFYVIKIDAMSDRRDDYLDEVLESAGKPYGLVDAVSAYIFRRAPSDNGKVECMELANNVMESMGYTPPHTDIPGESFDELANNYEVVQVVEG